MHQVRLVDFFEVSDLLPEFQNTCWISLDQGGPKTKAINRRSVIVRFVWDFPITMRTDDCKFLIPLLQGGQHPHCEYFDAADVRPKSQSPI